MPATTSSPTTSRTDSKHHSAKSRPAPPARKTRTVRRRGRARGDLESDDEFAREVATDSDSGDDDRSSVDSSSDSDTEPVSEDVLSNGHSRILTPNTTQSSADVPSLNHTDPKSSKASKEPHTPFLRESGSWSEMVAEETANGPAELPVIEFAELSGPSLDQHGLRVPPARKPAKSSKRPPVKRAMSAPTVDRPIAPPSTLTDEPPHERDEPASDQPTASTSRQSSRNNFVRRPTGQSARQAYQQRLESDPSYVPTVGEFWGHDDRLLDKDLRSLSGWWRGRWQGRGRGRGSFDRGFIRGRGRGGFLGVDPGHRETRSEGGPETQEAPDVPPELPRIDQTWTHDGYEEMKRRDEKRREPAQQPQAARPTRGFVPPRGRGGYIPGRGRGGIPRGGFAPSPTRPPLATPTTPGRTWYMMKPERVWTKQHEAFLYFDPALKPRPGVGPGYRVKLSNKATSHVVRGPVGVFQPPAETIVSSRPPSSEDGDKAFVVRLPKRKETSTQAQTPALEPATTIEESHIEDVFVVRPELVPPRVPITENQPASAVKFSSQDASSSSGPSSQPASLSTAPAAKITSPLLQQFMQEAAGVQFSQSAAKPSEDQGYELQVDAPQAVEQQEPPVRRTAPPAPPPLQTVFPPPQPSPPYSSPYTYGSPLPPGIAFNQHGMAYEIATGRPVYLQAPVYTPRPMAHGMMTPPGLSYLSGHMHHHSTGSPDFLAPSHTPPMNGFVDPGTGGPLFSFPRQSSRVEIRPPSSQPESKLSKGHRRPSGLRTSAAAFEPSQPASPAAADHYSSHDGGDSFGEMNSSSEQQVDPAMLGYSAYPQPYYYPEHYGYSQYYDMSHMPQYEMYPGDPHASQAVYY